MINENYVKCYCSEDISLIENYEKAINDNTQTWDCHHRRETDEGLSAKQLDELGLLFDRPASELIFLTKSEHHRLHYKGINNKGENNPMYGKHHLEATRKKQSESLKGEKNPNYGKPSAIRGKHRVYHKDGRYHYEN